MTFLNELTPDATVLVIVGISVLGGALTLVGGLAVILMPYQWRKAREAEVAASLKSEMLRQGMTAEQIERVLAAGQPRG